VAIVKAQAGDTLCVMAMEAGFLNCAPLRALPENAPFLSRDLKAGDNVTIPDVDPSEVDKPTTQLHVFVRQTSPPVSIRFVRGSKSTPYLQDPDSPILNVSNYRTTKAGDNGQQGFPSAFEFQQPGDADLDTFKVEVVDPAAGATVNVLLEAMKPIYTADPATGALTVTDHQPFGIAERQIPALSCAKVHSGVAYRSKYLRLVVDALAADPQAADKQAVTAQTLLVTDMADGNGTGQAGDNDTVEILDQEVRASYVIARCPGSPKCTVRAQLGIGGAERRKIAIAIHIYRATVGGANIGGITEQNVRLRAFKWFRRVYAQANLGPMLVAPFVTTEDPPAADMLVVSPDSGAPPTGVSISGGASSFSCVIEAAPGVAAGTVPSTPISVDLSAVPAPRAPSDVADAIIAALPAGFTGQKFINNLAFSATNGSADIIISHSSGARLAIRSETTDESDLDFTVIVTRVNIAALFAQPPDDAMMVNTADMRRVMRQIPGADNVFHFYVIGDLVNQAGKRIARGIAVLRGTDLGGAFLPLVPIRNKAFLTTRVMDTSDNNPFSFPHEAGHVMGDVFHVDVTDPIRQKMLMHSGEPKGSPTKKGTSALNAETATKRISDLPVLVLYEMFDPAQPTAGATTSDRINAVDRFRTKGAGLLRPW
jgi:tetrahydromethanopterin S-methyltransferase subunit G